MYLKDFLFNSYCEARFVSLNDKRRVFFWNEFLRIVFEEYEEEYQQILAREDTTVESFKEAHLTELTGLQANFFIFLQECLKTRGEVIEEPCLPGGEIFQITEIK